MPQNTDFTRKIFEVITHAVSVFLVMVLFFILQHVFDMHFVCSCKEGLHRNGVLYMTAPPLILAFIVTIIEPFHKIKVSRSMFAFCRSIRRSYCTYFVKWVVKYVSLCAVWIATVLFDGDWYFCVMTNFNKSQTGMPCRNNLTYEEQRIKDKYMADSLDCGLYVICSFLFLWCIAEIRKAYCGLYPRCKCYDPSFSLVEACCVPCSRCRCCDPYYSVIYDELLAQQVSSHLNDELKVIATEKAKNICESYLETIRKHEMPQNNGNPSDDLLVSEVWEKISASGFYLKEAKR